MAGIKLNLKDALLIKATSGIDFKRVKGKSSSGVSFIWSSPITITVDSSISNIAFVLVRGASTIFWGDGSKSQVPTSNNQFFSHTYSQIDTYDITIYPNESGLTCQTADNNIIGIKSFSFEFSQTPVIISSNLTSAPSYLPSTTTDVSSLFNSASSFNDTNVTLWDTSSVTNMQSVFERATNFNQNISSWDTSSVTNMKSVFERATNFNQNISSWDTSSVTNMESLFEIAQAFDQPIGSWSTSSVTNFRLVFRNAIAFNQDISGWDTSSVTDMLSAFSGATSFNQNLGSWDISSVTTLSAMFNNSGMSTENYSRTLIGWANSHFAGNAQDNVPLGASGVTYNNTAYTTGNQFNDAVSARAYLVGTAGWTITDGGQV